MKKIFIVDDTALNRNDLDRLMEGIALIGIGAPLPTAFVDIKDVVTIILARDILVQANEAVFTLSRKHCPELLFDDLKACLPIPERRATYPVQSKLPAKYAGLKKRSLGRRSPGSILPY